MAKIGKQFKGASKEKAGGKKGKLTDEELRMQAEMQRLLEEEKRRQAEERRKRMLKERQAQEEKYSRVNRLKITNQWRKLMRLVKVEDLRKEIEIISQNHEREVDRKDAIIQMLDRDLEESEEQYQMALRSHLQVIDRLIELHAQRTKALDFDFERDLADLSHEFAEEKSEMVSAHAMHKKELQDIMTLMERDYNENEEDARQETDGQREEIKNRNAEDYNMLRDQLENTIKRIEDDFDTAHRDYMATTETREQEFKTLVKRDKSSSETIDIQTRRLQRLQDSINYWRTKIANNARECEERNRAMREEKDAIARHYQDLKARMAKFRDAEARRLQELTLNSRRAIGSLKEKLKKAENILKLAELNRKMETEREKVLPFYASTVEDEDSAAQSVLDVTKTLQATATGRDGKQVEEWDYLNSFFKRYNKVLLDELAISREKVRLEQENSDLRAILKQYLDGISVNDDVLNDANPLLIMNNRSNVAAPPMRPPGRQVVIEAAHKVMIPQLTSGRQGASI